MGVFVRVWATALLMMWMAWASAQSAQAQALPNTGPYLVIDASTGDVIAQERAGETWYPASITKVMTAYIVFQRLRDNKLFLTQEIPVSALASSQEPSKIGIPAGGSVTVDFALQTLLVHSANDMAYVLAEAASGTVEAFARDMNAAAEALGLSATHFINPNGLHDPRHVSSARDLAILAAVIHNEFPQHAHFFDQEFVQVGKRKLFNTNALLRIMEDADGMKTGFICNSGFNLLATATRNGRKLIAVVLGAKSGYGRAVTTKELFDKAFSTPKSANALKVAEIVNLPQGAIVPADLTRGVCKSKTPVQLAGADGLQGWAVSFGTYGDMLRADMALRGRLLSPIGINTRASSGVVELPEKAGFAAMMWGIEQDQTLKLCTAYRQDGAHCDVMPPALVEQIASVLRAKAPPPKAVPQGADDDVSLPPEARQPARKKSSKKPSQKKSKKKK
jgi:D-alanyl-D-alanine carboxypeptidase